MQLYRICTEATGDMRERAIAEVAKVFDGFTVLDAVGFWRGQREASMVIEILADGRKDEVRAVANAICATNKQQCVCIQTLGADYWMAL